MFWFGFFFFVRYSPTEISDELFPLISGICSYSSIFNLLTVLDIFSHHV